MKITTQTTIREVNRDALQPPTIPWIIFSAMCMLSCCLLVLGVGIALGGG